MFDPRNIWIMLGIIAALYAVYATMQTPPQSTSEPIAYLRTTIGSTTKVTNVTRNDCMQAAPRLWAEADGEVACLAYIMPASQPTGATAIVFFHGDFPKARQTANKMARTRRSYEGRIARLARMYNVPVFAIARPGVMGSTGFHVIGGVRQEHALIANALDTLKQRHGIERIILGGQSGGARLAAQLLASGRNDIACAVMASGAYGIPEKKGGGQMPTNIWGDPSRSYLIPIRNVTNVTPDASRRLFIIGDVRDQRTPFDGQRKWAKALTQAGHNAVLLSASARGKEFHYLAREAMQIAGMCATGKDDTSIRRYVNKLPRTSKL